MGYVSITPQAEPLLGEAPALKRWWEAVSERPSFRDTPLKWSRIPSDAGAMPL